MGTVLEDLVDGIPAAFVLGRLVSDNIVLSHELVKGYSRKGISSRCMLKIDLQKAYDSIEWVYLEQFLTSLHLPDTFIKWIMTCLTSVTYSININGAPTPPFEAKRGMRQGDPMSPLSLCFSHGVNLCIIILSSSSILGVQNLRLYS